VKNGVPVGAARSLALIGDLRGMSPEFIRALNFQKYGLSLGIGIGVPIPILDEEMMKCVSIRDDQIFAPLLDYSVASRNRKPIKEINYADLRSGCVELYGKQVKTSSLSSYFKARIIAKRLKKWIDDGEFMLTQPVAMMPKERAQKPLEVLSKEDVV
jgi:uncharacterized protein (DUF39 family)